MSGKPRLLDLFCGAGGCTKGYQEAGFYVVGVDINPQPNYCGDEFFQGDALWGLRDLIAVWVGGGFLKHPMGSFDAIHASPPCQSYSRALRHLADAKPQLLDPVRELLLGTGSHPAMNPHNAEGRKRIGYAPETQWREAMGVPWMNKDETRQAIPPRYTRFIGDRLLSHILLSHIEAESRKAA